MIALFSLYWLFQQAGASSHLWSYIQFSHSWLSLKKFSLISLFSLYWLFRHGGGASSYYRLFRSPIYVAKPSHAAFSYFSFKWYYPRLSLISSLSYPIFSCLTTRPSKHPMTEQCKVWMKDTNKCVKNFQESNWSNHRGHIIAKFKKSVPSTKPGKLGFEVVL